MPASLDDLSKRVLAFRDDRDWSQFHKPKDLALALNIEAGELAELFLWKTDEQTQAIGDDPVARAALADELADVLIYALLLADRFAIDPSAAILAKLEKNAAKYPVHKAKGNAIKYTEYEG